MEERSVAFVTLGCKLNYSESSAIARDFAARGYRIVNVAENPGIIVVNTCSVTAHADKKCRNIIRRLHQRFPSAKIAVTGCYAQLNPDVLAAIEGVVAVVGTRDKGDLCRIVDSAPARALHAFRAVPAPFAPRAASAAPADSTAPSAVLKYPCNADDVTSVFPAYSAGERTRSFLKVQDGCDFRCSYCTVPIARGHSRNVPISTLVEQAREIAASGVCEIVLTGVNTGDFGRTTGESFLDLLKALDKVKGISRYRISSIEPNLLGEEIVDWIAAGGKFLPHFHIPLQSGCDRILAAMRRRYTTAQFESKINYVRDAMESPQERYTKVFFGIDVIVGFPGESDADFATTYSFLERIRPAFLHVFPYSRRPGTPAADMPCQVEDGVKGERVAALEALSARLHDDFCRANRGRRARVLFESREKSGMMTGYTENYIRVSRPFEPDAIGRITELEI